MKSTLKLPKNKVPPIFILRLGLYSMAVFKNILLNLFLFLMSPNLSNVLSTISANMPLWDY